MQDDLNSQTRRHFDGGEGAEEQDTVRILPEHMDAGEDGEPGDTPALRRGTLYTPTEAAYTGRDIAPYEPATQRHAPRRSAPLQQREVTGGESSAQQTSSPTPVVVRRGPSACVILAGTFSLLAVACALLAFATLQGGLSGFGKLTGVIPSFNFGIVTTPTVTLDMSRPAVIDQIRSLSKLETVNYELEKVVSGKSSGPLPDFLTSDKILLVAHGEVVAGIDLSNIQPQDVITNGTGVTVRLPKSQILYSKLDNEKTYVYDRQTGLFNKPDPNLESSIRTAAEQQIVQAATEDGILSKADENARQVLRTLLTGLGYKNVQFESQ